MHGSGTSKLMLESDVRLALQMLQGGAFDYLV